MSGEPGQPAQGVKWFGWRVILGMVNDPGRAGLCVGCRDARHALGRKRRPDNISCQVLQTLRVVWPEGLSAIDVKSAVMPSHHVVDNKIIDETFLFKRAALSLYLRI